MKPISQQQLDPILLEIFNHAAYYQAKLDDNVMKMFRDDLVAFGLTVDEVKVAFLKYRRQTNPPNLFMPKPAQLLALVRPEFTPTEEARELASTIMKAISKCGSWNGSDAEKMIGSIGWRVVLDMGGWGALCSAVTLQNETSYSAQIRELCAVALKRAAVVKTRQELPSAPVRATLEEGKK